jgi:phage tail-like protein
VATHDPAAVSQPTDAIPLLNTCFDVTFDGLPPMGFCSVEGIEAAFEAQTPVSPKEGATSGSRRERGATLVLRRGATGSKVLWNWYVAARSGSNARRDGAITVRNAAGQPILQVSLRNALPYRWRLGRLDALQAEVLLEEIELIVETLALA